MSMDNHALAVARCCSSFVPIEETESQIMDAVMELDETVAVRSFR